MGRSRSVHDREQLHRVVRAKHCFRRNAAAAGRYAKQFPHIPLFTISQLFGNWNKAQKTYFADGGVFDQIYLAKR